MPLLTLDAQPKQESTETMLPQLLFLLLLLFFFCREPTRVLQLPKKNENNEPTNQCVLRRCRVLWARLSWTEYKSSRKGP